MGRKTDLIDMGVLKLTCTPMTKCFVPEKCVVFGQFHMG